MILAFLRCSVQEVRMAGVEGTEPIILPGRNVLSFFAR
jgi:hypothetical protein